MVIRFFDLMRIFIVDSRFTEVFIENRASIFTGIVLPNFLVSSHELEDLQENPNEFTNYCEDLLTSRKSDTIKNKSVDFLLIFLKYIDGSLSEYFRIISSTLSTLIASPLKISEEIQQGIFKNAWFFYSTPETLFDSCLLGLSVIHELITDREDLKIQFREILTIISDLILKNNTSVLLKSRFMYLLTFSLHDQLGVYQL